MIQQLKRKNFEKPTKIQSLLLMRVLDPKKSDRAYFVEAANGSGENAYFRNPLADLRGPLPALHPGEPG